MSSYMTNDGDCTLINIDCELNGKCEDCPIKEQFESEVMQVNINDF